MTRRTLVFALLVAVEAEKWWPLVKAAGIKPE
jgi:hypothetical protein